VSACCSALPAETAQQYFLNNKQLHCMTKLVSRKEVMLRAMQSFVVWDSLHLGIDNTSAFAKVSPDKTPSMLSMVVLLVLVSELQHSAHLQA
jgi:hypothetical protein